jgi:hypothetical protein
VSIFIMHYADYQSRSATCARFSGNFINNHEHRT